MGVEQVRIDHADGLHQGIHRGRSDEAESLLLQSLRQGHGLRSGRRDLGDGARPRRLRRLERPQKRIEPAIFTQLDHASSVVDASFDLAPMANDPGVGQQLLDLDVAEAGNGLGIESGEDSRNRSRFFRIVSQESPAWNPSRLIRSNSPASSWMGRPHSLS